MSAWKPLRCAAAVLMFAALAITVAGQPKLDNYSLDVWQTEQGLPDSSVTAIAQTLDGYLWVGTFLGLARFDGTHFEVFDSRTPGLESERVLRLHGDATGALWVSMEPGNLARYAHGRFTSFGPEQGWPMEPCRVIASDSEGHMLFFTRTGGLFRYENGRFVRLLPSVEASWPADALAVDANPGGRIWTKRGDELGWLNRGEWNRMQVSASAGSDKIGAITPSHRGGIWAFAAGRLLRIKGPDSVQSVPYPSFMDPNLLAEDSAGNLWLGTWGQGLVELVPGEPPREYSMATGFPDDSIRCFFEDREGNLWVGTNGGGLVRLRRKAFHSYGREQGFPPMHPLSLAEGAPGRVWLGFLDGGIFSLDTSKPPGRLSQRRVPGRKIDPTVWSLLSAGDGRTWIGTFGDGVFLLESNAPTWQPVTAGLAKEEVYALCEDTHHTLWIGTGTGLSSFDGHQCVTCAALAGISVQALAQGQDGALWVGTLDRGLVRIKEGQITRFTRKGGLPHDSVHVLLPDSDGLLWVGTAGGLGVVRGDQITPLTRENGLPTDSILAIVDDGLGYLWFGSNHGIYRVRRSELQQFIAGERKRVECIVYGKSDGLLSTECGAGTPSGFRARDGRLWFATAKGVSVVDPRSLPQNTNPPSVLIEAVLIDGQVVPGALSPKQTGDGAENSPTQLPEVIVPPGPHRLEVRYTGISLGAPERVQFRYRLGGFAQQWQEVSGSRVASYQGLRPDRYEFQVEAANRDGVWSPGPAALSIVIRPRLWETAWFRLSAGVLTAGLLLAAYRRRIARLEHARAVEQRFSERLIESQEQERKRIAAELHDGLGQNLVLMKNLALLPPQAGDSPAERSRELAAAAGHALDEIHAISYALRPPELDRLGLCKALAGMVRRSMQGSGIRFETHLELAEALPNGLDIHLFRIAQEAVNNVVKHSGAHSARVELWADEGGLHLVVADDGRGLGTAILDRNGSGRGLGISGIEERTRLLGAQCKWLSEPGKGTTLSVLLPQRAFSGQWAQNAKKEPAN